MEQNVHKKFNDSMNFFCSGAEFDQYVTQMELDPDGIIKADIEVAVREAKATFEV
ncbi:hypothetical protein C817_02855 [Dorea sp. 5-2]|nr:hypothetical protein C817_02855 [Dorea sp. 5-2]